MNRKNIKVVFMGTPEFAKASLEALIDSGYNVCACFTNPDKPSGRGMKLKPSAVKECATMHNIKVYQPKKVRNNEEVINILKEMAPDFIAVVAYGKILPKEILDIPKYGCINVHSSLLPKYRGAAPMQWAIINGEKETGVTTMFMDEGMDTGDILLTKKIEIKDSYNFEDVHDILMNIGAELLVKTLDEVASGTAVRKKQEGEASYACQITREMTKIDFSKSATQIFNFVRGLSPFPGTYMQMEDGRIFKVFKVEHFEDDSLDESIKPGDILLMSKDALYIKCKDGYVSILEIQPQNSRRMDIKSFMSGNRINMLDRFI